MSTTASPLAGTFAADPVHSNFAFAVRYQGVSLFKGTLDAVEATLTDGKLVGKAQIESISIRTPEQFRAHVLGGEDFFQADKFPEVTFVSTGFDVKSDNTVEVTGDLTIKDTTKPVTAKGTWVAPAPDAFGNTRAHLNLETVIDRTEWGLTWNAPLPSGGVALANKVTLTIELALVEQA
jgi:polyisoprenoid-binding protein YceI